MKKFLAVVALLATWALLCGMGLFPEGSAKVPKTKENFSATVYDNTSISTKLTRFSIDGETYVPGRRGEGKLSIPFDKIEEITFRDGTALVRVKGTEQPVEVKVDGSLLAYGLSGYGPYQIKLKDLRRVVIHGKV